MSFFIYILECENKTYYTGYTTHLLRRFKEHQSASKKCKYTRSFKAIMLLQSWEVATKKRALQLERKIKKLSKAEKTNLILNPHTIHYL